MKYSKISDIHYRIPDNESYEYRNCVKVRVLFGCDEFDANPPFCCRLLKRLGFCYMINRYFRRNAKRIHDIRSKLETDG